MPLTVRHDDRAHGTEELVLRRAVHAADDLDALGAGQRLRTPAGDPDENVIGQVLPYPGDLLEPFAAVNQSEESHRLGPVLGGPDRGPVPDDVRNIDGGAARVRRGNGTSPGLGQRE